MKNLLHILSGVLIQVLIAFTVFSQVNTGTIFGKVITESNDAMPLCTVVLMENSHISTGIITDAEGNFIIGNLESGLYDLKISSVGFSSKYIRGIRIDGNEVSVPPIEMNWGVRLSSVVCSAYRPYCSKPCGFGCICECCVPSAEFNETQVGNGCGAFVKVDTTSFLALTRWRSPK